jgi:Cof subfamily protein (haloacid dehalogenase superfamily)
VPGSVPAGAGRPWRTLSASPKCDISVDVTVPARRPRLIATDLDGTLLRPDGSISERTRRALSDLAGVGIELVFVTARPPRWVDHLADLAGEHGTVLCVNGAVVYDVAQRSVIEAHGIPPTTVRAIAADLRQALPGIGFAAELADGIHPEREYPALHPADVPPAGAYGPIEDVDQPVAKLLARSLQVPEAEFLHRFAHIVGGRAQVTYSGAGGLAEIGPVGVTKASALISWCAARGISGDDVWAFGDMPNDLPMLAWAGTSFAVANAHPDVLAAASHRCPSNADDGVARVIESLTACLDPLA